jgi:hypothetical protein
MTINPQAVEWLQARAIDPETASRMGTYTAGRGPDGEHVFIAAAAVVAVVTAVPASAQTSTVTTTTSPSATGSLTIAPEKRTVIKQRFTGAPVTTVKEKVTVGATVPADVELMAVPDTVVTELPTVKSYRYFRYNDDVVLVDPSSRRVVQIID